MLLLLLMMLTSLLAFTLLFSEQEPTGQINVDFARDRTTHELTVTVEAVLSEPAPSILLVSSPSNPAWGSQRFPLPTKDDGTGSRVWQLSPHFQQNHGQLFLQLVHPQTRSVLASTTISITAQGDQTHHGGPAPVPAIFHYVDGTLGNDSNAGTAQAPWRTIQKSADNALPGSTVILAAGIYRERVVVHVSGSAAAGITTFLGAPGGGTILDASTFGNAEFSSWNGAFGQGLIDITNQSHLRFENLEIRNLTTNSTNYFLMGVQIAKTQGNPQPMSTIELVNLNVHDIRYTGSNSNGGAQGIAVYGGSTNQAITNVLIEDCEVHHLSLGQSEAMTLNGNVDGFLIDGNEVHDNDNIGIVCIGWEGTAGGSQSDNSSDANAHLYGGHHPLDRARNGVISNNLVYRCSNDAPISNPTYPQADFSAGGIYVDGGHSIVIERNTVFESDVGIEVGCEHGGVDTNGSPRDTRDIIVRNNDISYCGQYGIGLGGYNRFRGVASQTQVTNNTVYKCSSLGWGGGQILLAKSHDNLIANNILVARGPSDTTDYDGHNNSGQAWQYDHGVVIGSSVGVADNHNNTLDSNLYFVEGGANKIFWKWEKDDNQDPVQGFQGLAAIDGNALYGDPNFVNPTLGRTQGTEDFHLASQASPAVDNGDTSLSNLGAVDLDGLQRVWNAIVDRGAFEWGSVVP